MADLSLEQHEAMERVLREVVRERIRQHAKWGEQAHPDGTGSHAAQLRAREAREDCVAATELGCVTWRHILREEVEEAIAELEPEKLRAELLQVAAVAVQWIEALDRRGGR